MYVLLDRHRKQFIFQVRQKNFLSTQIFFFKHAKLERVTKFGKRERGNVNLGTRKKSLEKARGNAERKEKKKERITRRACRNARPALQAKPQTFKNLRDTVY